MSIRRTVPSGQSPAPRTQPGTAPNSTSPFAKASTRPSCTDSASDTQVTRTPPPRFTLSGSFVSLESPSRNRSSLQLRNARSERNIPRHDQQPMRHGPASARFPPSRLAKIALFAQLSPAASKILCDLPSQSGRRHTTDLDFPTSDNPSPSHAFANDSCEQTVIQGGSSPMGINKLIAPGSAERQSSMQSRQGGVELSMKLPRPAARGLVLDAADSKPPDSKPHEPTKNPHRPNLRATAGGVKDCPSPFHRTPDLGPAQDPTSSFTFSRSRAPSSACASVPGSCVQLDTSKSGPISAEALSALLTASQSQVWDAAEGSVSGVDASEPASPWARHRESSYCSSTRHRAALHPSGSMRSMSGGSGAIHEGQVVPSFPPRSVTDARSAAAAAYAYDSPKSSPVHGSHPQHRTPPSPHSPTRTLSSQRSNRAGWVSPLPQGPWPPPASAPERAGALVSAPCPVYGRTSFPCLEDAIEGGGADAAAAAGRSAAQPSCSSAGASSPAVPGTSEGPRIAPCGCFPGTCAWPKFLLALMKKSKVSKG